MNDMFTGYKYYQHILVDYAVMGQKKNWLAVPCGNCASTEIISVNT